MRDPMELILIAIVGVLLVVDLGFIAVIVKDLRDD